MRTISRELFSLDDTQFFGRQLAELARACNPGTLLLQGELGAGKTTLIRALVTNLSGGNEADISSPSFTICNIYYTAPLVHHFDLYRLEPGTPDDALAESFDTPEVLTLVEWPEHIAPQDMPRDGLWCGLFPYSSANIRRAELKSLGPEGERCMALFFSGNH